MGLCESNSVKITVVFLGTKGFRVPMQNPAPAPANEQPLLQSAPDVESLEPSASKPSASFSRPRLVCYTILSLFGLFVLSASGCWESASR